MKRSALSRAEYLARLWTAARMGAVVSVAVTVSACASAPLAAQAVSTASNAKATTECRVGVYRSPSGNAVAISKGAETGRFFYKFARGNHDYVDSDDTPVKCVAGAVVVAGGSDTGERWPKVEVRETRAQFVRDGISFHGVLVEPLDTPSKLPLMILGHGSGKAGAVPAGGAINTDQYLFAAAQGLSSFIFDKRGTGESGGKFVMNFATLAEDMVAASVEARRLAKGRFSRFGFWGPSQGGWVAPLAARDAAADFVVVSFGLVLSPHEEEREEVIGELEKAGYDGDAIAKAQQVTDAVGALIASRFQSGYQKLSQLKKAYGTEPWFRHLIARREALVGPSGLWVGDLLHASEAELRARSDDDHLELDWNYDPMPVLRSSPVPTLWIIAGEDREAPPRITIERLTTLQKEGKPIQLAVFPDTDHGMVEFTEQPDGTRTYTGLTEGYYRLVADWVKGRLSPPYGRATFHPPLE